MREGWVLPAKGWVPPDERGPLALDSPAAHTGLSQQRPAIFLDRDGVLNAAAKDPESGFFEAPLRLADVHLLPGVADALERLAAGGYALVCTSNQPLAAKGKTTLDELIALHERVLGLLEEEGAHLDGSRLCPHHPNGSVAEFSGPCPCRKPAPGMLLDAARDLGLDLDGSWMLGDTDADVQAGQAAGARTVLIEYPPSAHKRVAGVSPDLHAADLPDAVSRLLERERG